MSEPTAAELRLARKLAPLDPEPPKESAEAKAEAAKIKKAAKEAARKKAEVHIIGKAPVDDQFHGDMEFSPAYGVDAGRTYGAQLIVTPTNIVHASPQGNKDFYERLKLEQNRVDPLLQGFQTEWFLPPGWSFVDGLGSMLWDEAISNPIYITRVIHSPADPNDEIGFLVVVRMKYKP